MRYAYLGAAAAAARARDQAAEGVEVPEAAFRQLQPRNYTIEEVCLASCASCPCVATLTPSPRRNAIYPSSHSPIGYTRGVSLLCTPANMVRTQRCLPLRLERVRT